MPTSPDCSIPGTRPDKFRTPSMPPSVGDGDHHAVCRRAVSGPVLTRPDLTTVAELFEPLLHLLVVVPAAAVRVWRGRLPERLESPPCHFVAIPLVEVPLSGPIRSTVWRLHAWMAAAWSGVSASKK